MPISLLLIMLGCLIASALVRRVFQPMVTVPAVFVHLVLGMSLGWLGRSAWGQEHALMLQDAATLQALELMGWLGILMLMTLGTSDPPEEQAYAPQHTLLTPDDTESSTGCTGDLRRCKSSPYQRIWLWFTPCRSSRKTHCQPSIFRREGYTWARVLTISLVGFGGTLAVATLGGYGLAWWAPQWMGKLAQPWVFALAIGLACSVTALPVLVSLLHECYEHHSFIGRLAIRVAVLDDVWLWLVLMVILGMVRPGASPFEFALKVLGFVACGWFVFKPVLTWLYQKLPLLHPANNIVLGLTVVVCMATISELLGTHALFGAVMSGLILPAHVLRSLKTSLMPMCQALLLPFFFITTGMKVNVQLSSADFLWLALGFTFMGMALKMSFVGIAARYTGLPWGQSLQLGALLQCKGLMEVVVLGMMREAQVIGVEVFSALMVMALLCTVLTMPLRSWVGRFMPSS